ncbi:MAG: hypothetical protein M1816_004661 [Peltula sp. TS41687]|nr:MAG: hypothetical protein M1816_004661 [Peltula sp. TS41687]
MYLAKLLTTSLLLLWTSGRPILAFPQFRPDDIIEERPSDHEGDSNTISQGGKLALAGGAIGAEQARLTTALERSDDAHAATRRQAAAEKAELETKIASLEAKIYGLEREAKQWELVQRHDLRPGRFEKALKDLNGITDRKKKECMALLLTDFLFDLGREENDAMLANAGIGILLKEVNPVESTGREWNQVVLTCKLDETLLIWPAEKILIGLDPDNEEEFIGGYPKPVDEDPKTKNADPNKSDFFAPVRDLFQDRLKTIGGIMRKGQQGSGSGLPSGMLPAGRVGRVPVGVGAF